MAEEIKKQEVVAESKENKKEKKICADDKVIVNIGATVLTEEYIAQSGKALGNEFYKCIFLKDVSSFEYGYKSYPMLIILAALFFIGFLVNSNEAGLLVVAVVCFIAFFLSRRNAVIVSAHNKETIVQPLGQKMAEAKEFVQKAIQTKKNFTK